jgi:SAM-dependent methyltransferase
MTEISAHALKYWQYEYDVSSRYMVPLLEQWGVTLRGLAVLDVGCGEGGGLCALSDRGAQSFGFDIDGHRVQVAQQLKGARAIEFTIGNLYEDQLPFLGTRYDLVVLHDVFEHLDQKVEILRKLRGLMTPTSAMLITFPPYYSAYGAHQQHLQAWYAQLPFVHLVPYGASVLLPRLKNEFPHVVEEIQKLARLKMGMRGFEKIVRDGGFRIAHRKAYLISPNHIRFGLRPVSAGFLEKVPYVRELICTGAVYLLSR